MFGRKRQIAELNAQADQLLEHARWLQEQQAEAQAHIEELHRLLDKASTNGLLLHNEIEEAKRNF
jgi:alpha-D-ribose 1-methylphosphonate 5-triphosphate synthase subunit PhnG